MSIPLVTLLGRMTLAFLESIGSVSAFAAQAVRSAFQPPWYGRQILRQIMEIGYYSLPVVGLTAIFTGMVLALQSYTGFARFSAESAIPNVVVVSLTRELGPVLAALMVAGRVGAAMAAEIGTMRVTEQIDALTTLSTNPFKYLVVPRLIAGILTLPVLVLVADIIGVLGGFLGGRVDDAVLFAITTRLSIPVVLVALAVVGLLGSSMTLLVVTLGLLLWDRFAVVARSTTMQVRNLDFVAAAWCAGCSRFRILSREVLPNIASHLVVVATLEIALAILLEAALSFLGLGVPPPLPSWGLMIAEAKDYMFFSPWVIVIPGVALFVLVLGINLLGDGLRDTFGARTDP